MVGIVCKHTQRDRQNERDFKKIKTLKKYILANPKEAGRNFSQKIKKVKFYDYQSQKLEKKA